MRGISHKKHLPDPIPVRQPRIHRISRRPANLPHPDHAPRQARIDERLKTTNRKIDIPLERNRRLKLEQFATRQRAEPHHPRHVAMVEPVPHGPIQALQHDIGNNRPPPSAPTR